MDPHRARRAAQHHGRGLHRRALPRPALQGPGPGSRILRDQGPQVGDLLRARGQCPRRLPAEPAGPGLPADRSRVPGGDPEGGHRQRTQDRVAHLEEGGCVEHGHGSGGFGMDHQRWCAAGRRDHHGLQGRLGRPVPQAGGRDLLRLRPCRRLLRGDGPAVERHRLRPDGEEGPRRVSPRCDAATLHHRQGRAQLRLRAHHQRQAGRARHPAHRWIRR